MLVMYLSSAYFYYREVYSNPEVVLRQLTADNVTQRRVNSNSVLPIKVKTSFSTSCTNLLPYHCSTLMVSKNP